MSCEGGRVCREGDWIRIGMKVRNLAEDYTVSNPTPQ